MIFNDLTAKMQNWGLLCSCFFSLFLSTALSAQNSDYDAGNAYFQSSLYKEAILSYEKALEREPDLSQARAKLADCYRLVNNPQKASALYADLVQLLDGKKYLWDYAQTLRSSGRYAEAKEQFLRYAQQIDNSKGQQLARSCEWAAANLSNLSPMFSVENMEALNSKNADFAPTFYQEQLLFASSRSVAKETNGLVNWTNDAFNQYYQATGDSKLGVFSAAKPLRNFIGKDINDAPMSFSGDGSWVAITSNNFMDGIRQIDGSGMLMDIYVYEALSKNEWKQGSQQFFAYNASADAEIPFSTGTPFINDKGDAIYFASNRPGGFGGYDIYISYRTGKGWSLPKNLGSPINTAGNEFCPFVDQFERLYFVSDYHYGYGGTDIFSAEKRPYGWANLQNLGTGVNSAYDEMYFIINTAHKVGYFASNRPNGKGNEDIYKAQQLRGFAIAEKKILNLGEQYVFRNIQFGDQNELTFTRDEQEQMLALLTGLNDNPDIIIQLFAYTDARGASNSNQTNSVKRAAALANFLINNGINNSRIVHNGYGEAYPINNCRDGVNCNDAEHALNRRIEISLVGRKNQANSLVYSYDASPDTRKSSKKNPITFRTRPRPIEMNGAVAVLNEVNPPIFVENTNPENRKTEPRTEKPKNEPKTEKPRPETKNETRRPVRKQHYAINDKIDIANIYYENQRSTVDEKKSAGLKEILDLMIDQPYIVVEIGSHTDANGEEGFNLELSRKRAESVKNYLVKKGIPAARLTTKGYGESQLINRCKEGVKCSDDELAANRRTEFKVVGQKGFRIGDIIQVDRIDYERNDVKIDMKRSKGLQEILQILKETNLVVEIRSHTDANGTGKYNLDISEKRARAIYDYLVKNGIGKSRLKYKGYGEQLIRNRCKDNVKCSDEEHDVNRRTDFKIIGGN